VNDAAPTAPYGADNPGRSSLLRARGEGHARVGMVELFFDLVFVFAITQLSHALAHAHGAGDVLRWAVLFLGVWWAWIDTAWVTNWLDPECNSSRALLFTLMALGLVLSMSIPEAFGEKGLYFGIAYALFESGRSAFMVWAIGPAQPALRVNFVRILCWQLAAAPFWIAGGLATPEWRLPLWILALGIWTAGPILTFRVPGLGASTTRDWTVEGGHMAERCGLFVIIALGESILVSGTTFARLPWDALHAAAFAAAFLSSIAMWWIYFHIGAERGTRHIAESDDPGRIARLGYTYLHIPIVAGIVLCAVSDEIILAHPTGHTGWAAAAAILGGPALYLAGNGFFKRLSFPNFPLSHQVGLAALTALVVAAPFVAPLLLAGLATAVLIVVAVWEHLSIGGHEVAA